MTNKMPTRSTPTSRPRDWGNTPVLFSLKNVQPMLVSGPARPEGNVGATSSISTESPIVSNSERVGIPTPPIVPELPETRTKPVLAPTRKLNLQNVVVSSFVVLLILFVVRISISKKPEEADVAKGTPKGAEVNKTASTEIAAATTPLSTTTSSTSSPEAPAPKVSALGVSASDVSIPELAKSSGPAEPPVTSTAPVSSTGVAAADVPEVEESGAKQEEIKVPNPPLLIASGNPVPSHIASPVPPTPDAFNSEVPPATTEFMRESAKPGLSLGPASSSDAVPQPSTPSLDLSSNTPKDVAVDIQQTLTPNHSMEAFKEIWAQANQQPSGTLATAPQASIPYTPVSTSGSSNPYQPIQSPLPASSPNPYKPAPQTPYQPIGGAATVTNPFVTQEQGNLVNPNSGMGPNGGAAPTFSGQAYPPPAQGYQPITVQDSGAINRYPQTIRQPSSGAAPAAPAATQAPYVPIGPTSNSFGAPNTGFPAGY